jgi:hypothetical protein
MGGRGGGGSLGMGLALHTVKHNDKVGTKGEKSRCGGETDNPSSV